MSSYYEELGKMLHDLRVCRDFKQETVAKALGIGRSTYSDMERARIRPQIEHLFKLAELYHVLPETFLYPEDYRHPETTRERASKKAEE